MANSYPFYTCDVFTNTQFTGNPLAVLPHADGLTSEQMQHIAREFNYSETAFVFNQPASTPQFTRQVRIFTPMQEIPFAGHPNIGTAFTLASLGELGDLSATPERQLCFIEKAGDVPMRVFAHKADEIWAELQAPQALQLGQVVSVDLVAAALSLKAADIATHVHVPQVVSVGLPFVVVAVNNKQALANAQVNLAALTELSAKGISPDFYVYTQSQETKQQQTNQLYARMFAPLDGIVEDPATGSAACALVAFLSALYPRLDTEFNWCIHQGAEMGRPSKLVLRTIKNVGVVEAVYLAGTCKMIMQGEIFI